MAQVAAQNTPVTASEVLGAILANTPNLTGARIILAQSAFETGGWQKGVWNYNLGNIKYTGSGNYFTIPCTEVVNGQTQTQSCSFRAYGSLGAGAGDYVRFLAKHGLVAIANGGSIASYVAQLKAVGYATSLSTAQGYAAYENGMAAWYSRLSSVQPPAGFNVAVAEVLAFARKPSVILAGAAGIALAIVYVMPATTRRRRRAYA
jgi:hypothetical protein